MKKKKLIELRQIKFPIDEHLRAILLNFVEQHCEGNVLSAKGHLSSKAEESPRPFNPSPTFERRPREKIRIIALISNNDVIALSGFSRKDKFATNSWTVVRKSNRQKGIGRHLLKMKLALAKKEGVKIFNTTTAIANSGSRKMLENVNFHEIELYEGSKREMVRLVNFLDSLDLSEFDEVIKEIKCLEYQLR